MKSILMVFSIFALLLISSLGYALTVPTTVNNQGITFPDNTLQKSAAILPTCSPGEVYANINGAMVCGKIKLVQNGIATCITDLCSVSTCTVGYDNCDSNGLNGCETHIFNDVLNCGACAAKCPVNECQSATCTNAACGTIPIAIGTPCSIGFCNASGFCAPPACGEGILNVGEQCDDQNINNADGCSSVCQIERGYVCSGQPSVCDTVCGDRIVAGSEECDDGNANNFDGCSNTCSTLL